MAACCGRRTASTAKGSVLKLMFGGGVYRYTSGALGNVDVRGRQLAAAILPGWRFIRDGFIVTVFAGLDFQNHRLSPDDPTAGLRGSYVGLRTGFELWYEPTPDHHGRGRRLGFHRRAELFGARSPPAGGCSSGSISARSCRASPPTTTTGSSAPACTSPACETGAVRMVGRPRLGQRQRPPQQRSTASSGLIDRR